MAENKGLDFECRKLVNIAGDSEAAEVLKTLNGLLLAGVTPQEVRNHLNHLYLFKKIRDEDE